MLSGKYEQAQQGFEAALTYCDTQQSRADVAGKLGELAFKRRRCKPRRTRIIVCALRALGRTVPTNRLLCAAIA